ncbi:uracil permease [Streptococcus pneumoniae]|nr:uracil permease [Streptococcus pneumoniae]
MKQESTVDLLLDVDQRPSDGKGILLSFQHVFAMFGATILVPLILGMPVSVALFASGVGTLIYMIATGFKVPVYLGSSFAFITAMSLAMKEMGGDVSAAQTGVILTGLVYVLVATSIRFVGTKWIDKLLPPIIIGPMIIVIGLGLAGSAVTNAGLVADGNWKNALVAVVTFLIAAFINTKGKGFLRIIPFLFAIIGGYLFALTLGLVDFTPVLKANWFEIPGFYLPFSTGGAFKEYNLYFGPEAIAILPIAIVTISEHIGDHTVLGQICGRQFLKEPGLHRTLLGDGIATSVSAQKIHSHLASLNFSYPEMQHQIRSLSGGQQGKLLLLDLVLRKPNFLLLDEPTRNFSPTSQPQIRKLFATYPGGLITVSHDRRFLKEVCSIIYRMTEHGLELVNLEDL